MNLTKPRIVMSVIKKPRVKKPRLTVKKPRVKTNLTITIAKPKAPRGMRK